MDHAIDLFSTKIAIISLINGYSYNSCNFELLQVYTNKRFTAKHITTNSDLLRHENCRRYFSFITHKWNAHLSTQENTFLISDHTVRDKFSLPRYPV